MESKYTYQTLSLTDFLKKYRIIAAKSEFFELTTIWLQATDNHMLLESEFVLIHCLFKVDDNDHKELVLTWGLIHNTHQLKTIRSLGSFYSAITRPFCFQSEMKDEYFAILLKHISVNNSWQQMLLGPLEKDLSSFILSYFKFAKIYNQADNWYCDNIQSFRLYYSQRPSQLKNTIKRKEKKLTKEHSYHVEIVDKKDVFDNYFSDYKRIYQLSWKDEEASFEFIKQVCLKAAEENKLRMGILFVNNQAVAVQLWFLHKGTASIFKLAYDPVFKAYSVGSILSMALTKHVIEQDKVCCIEFGMGSEPYKKDWMDKKRQRMTLQVFNERSFFGALLAVRYIIVVKIKTLMSRSNKG